MPEQRQKIVQMKAMYDGECLVCSAPIYVGEEIEWMPGIGAVCMHCDAAKWLEEQE